MCHVSLAALITGDGWFGNGVPGRLWKPWSLRRTRERSVGLWLPWPQGGASPTQLAGLRPAALGLCHLAAWGPPLPARHPALPGGLRPPTGPHRLPCGALRVPGVPDWLLTDLDLGPDTAMSPPGCQGGAVSLPVSGVRPGDFPLQKRPRAQPGTAGCGQWGRPGGWGAGPGTRPQWSPGSAGTVCAFIFPLGFKSSAIWGGWSDRSVLTRVHAKGHGTGDENPRTPMDTSGCALRLTHLRRQGLGKKQKLFLPLAPVPGWKLMIHVLGRLRVSNQVTICFPLQRLYAFLSWLLQQALERRMLAEAKEEARREERGDARGEDAGQPASCPRSFQGHFCARSAVTRSSRAGQPRACRGREPLEPRRWPPSSWPIALNGHTGSGPRGPRSRPSSGRCPGSGKACPVLGFGCRTFWARVGPEPQPASWKVPGDGDEQASLEEAL